MEESKLPRKWKEEFITLVYQFALLGATDKELARAFDVDPMTIDYWKRTKVEFRESLQKGKMEADAQAAESLLKAAIGFYYTEEVAHVCGGEVVITEVRRYSKPNPWAANKWLSLRRRADWSETHRVDVTNRNLNVNLNFEDLSTEELKLMYSIGMKSKPIELEDGGSDD